MRTTLEKEDVENIVSAVIREITPLLKKHNSTPNDNWLSKEEAAELLGVKPRWFDGCTEKTGIPKYKIGGHIRFKKSELIKWADRQKILNIK